MSINNKNTQNSLNDNMSYRNIALHKVMLHDVVRTDTDEKFITEIIRRNTLYSISVAASKF